MRSRLLGEAEAVASADLLWYLTIAYWLLAINVVPYYILLGLGRIRFIGISCIVAGAGAIFSMYVAIQAIGLIGAASGRIVYAVLTLVLIFPLVQRISQKRISVAIVDEKSV